MHIGFTGTQTGLTDNQKEVLQWFLNSIGRIYLHHGDCIGADEQAHEMATALMIPIVIHPPSVDKRRAFCNATLIYSPLSYLQRNKVIVNRTDMLLACPKTAEEELRSGTWSTIRYARKLKRPVLIIEP